MFYDWSLAKLISENIFRFCWILRKLAPSYPICSHTEFAARQYKVSVCEELERNFYNQLRNAIAYSFNYISKKQARSYMVNSIDQIEQLVIGTVTWPTKTGVCNHAALPGPNAHNEIIGPRATAACVKVCELDNSLATHGRLSIPFKNRNACFNIWTFPQAIELQLPSHF